MVQELNIGNNLPVIIIKIFLRQLKSYDSCYTGKNVSGMAHITTDLSGFKLGPHHLDLIYVYGNLLGGNKSYVSSLFI